MTNKRNASLHLALGLCLLSHSGTALADQLHLKAGGTIKGRITAMNSGSYTLVTDEGEELEVPTANVSIADIDPGNPANKSHFIYYTEAPHTPRNLEEDGSKPLGNAVVVVPGEDPKEAFKKSGDFMKFAQDTVSESNARTEQTVKAIEGLKEIADSANK